MQPNIHMAMSDPLLLINDHSLYAIISVRYIVSAVQSRTNIHMYCVPPCEVTFARPAYVTKHYNLTSSVCICRMHSSTNSGGHEDARVRAPLRPSALGMAITHCLAAVHYSLVQVGFQQ